LIFNYIRLNRYCKATTGVKTNSSEASMSRGGGVLSVSTFGLLNDWY